MNQTLSNALASEVIRHTINVQRFEGEIRQRSLMELVRLDKILTGIIAQAPADVSRLRVLLAMAKSEINAAMSLAKQAALRDEERYIIAEATAAAKQINVAVGAPLATMPASTPEFIKAVRSKALVMGKPASHWWSAQSKTVYRQFASILRTGLLTGKTTGQMTTEWRRASNQMRRHAEAQVRTGMQSVMNAARYEMYLSNSSIVKGVQALATLDTRTSPLCRARDGTEWYFGI